MDYGQTNKYDRLDRIIDNYHTEMAEVRRSFDDHVDIEFEVRIKNITSSVFEKFLQSLFNDELGVRNPELIQSVEGIINGSKQFEKLIREIVYIDGEPRAQEYRIKSRIGNSIRIDYGVVPFSVNLSIEEPMTQFSLGSSPILRIKNRLRFKYPAKTPEWYIDTTIVQQLVGRSVKNLPMVIDRMFRHGGSFEPRDMFQSIVGPFKDDFKYEIEIEKINKSGKDTLSSYDMMEMIKAVFTVFNPNFAKETLYQNELGFVSNLIHRTARKTQTGLKRLLPSVRSLSHKTYRSIFPPLSFYLTEKADGIRALAVLRAGNCYVLGDDLYEFSTKIKLTPSEDFGPSATEGSAPSATEGSAPSATSGATAVEPAPRPSIDFDKYKERVFAHDTKAATVLDGEFLPKLNKFLSFDVIAFKGENFTQKTFKERQRVLPQATEIFYHYGLDATPKRFVHISDEETMKSAFIELKERFDGDGFGYRTDGVILTEPGKNYRDTVSYKWKDKEHSTIDFLARRCPGRIEGRSPFVKRPGFDLYLLFSAASTYQIEKLRLNKCPGYDDLFPDATGDYVPIQFSPSSNHLAYLYYHPIALPELDSLIVEMRCETFSVGPPDWIFVGIREDKIKDRGGMVYNNIAVAEETWMMTLEDFPYEDLYEPKSSYFNVTKSDSHKAHAAASSAIKAKKIMDFAHSAWVVDLGIGQGQDLKRYMDAQVENLIGVDVDKTALVTLTERKYNIIRRYKDCSPMSVSLVCGDVLEPDMVDRILEAGLNSNGADLVVSNFGINYFCCNLKTLRAFLSVCSVLTKLGGSLIITTFSGQKIMSELVNRGISRGQSWDLHDGDELKFSIRRKFEESVLRPTGQQIDVILPFSDGRYYSEYLVDPATIQEVLVEYGFDITEFKNMSAFVPEFKIRNPGMGEKLTESDQAWLSLQIQMTFKKNRRKASKKSTARRQAGASQKSTPDSAVSAGSRIAEPTERAAKAIESITGGAGKTGTAVKPGKFKSAGKFPRRAKKDKGGPSSSK